MKMKTIFKIPQYALGYILLGLSLAGAYVSQWVCFAAAYLLDEETWWKEDKKLVDEHFEKIDDRRMS